MSTYVLYDGPSMLDGQPIYSAVSGLDKPSGNRKTGAMGQTWIIRSDLHPINANRENKDVSVCGSCIHRGVDGKQRSCYVNLLMHGPHAIYQGRAEHKPLPKGAFRNRAVRLGAYGDPVAVSFEIYTPIVKQAALVLGYTHQWRNCNPEFKRILMASVDSEEEYHQAKEQGWRTFRVKSPDQAILTTEIECPYAAGKLINCYTCGKCNGTTGRGRDIVIDVHGVGKKHFILRSV